MSFICIVYVIDKTKILKTLVGEFALTSFGLNFIWFLCICWCKMECKDVPNSPACPVIQPVHFHLLCIYCCLLGCVLTCCQANNLLSCHCRTWLWSRSSLWAFVEGWKCVSLIDSQLQWECVAWLIDANWLEGENKWWYVSLRLEWGVLCTRVIILIVFHDEESFLGLQVSAFHPDIRQTHSTHLQVTVELQYSVSALSPA